MKPEIKPCDNCGLPVDVDYAATPFGVRLCDACMAGDALDPFATLLHERRGIRLEVIEDTCKHAEGLIPREQINPVRESVEHARELFAKGKRDAAMEAGQAAWNYAQDLFHALTTNAEARTGRRVRRPFNEANDKRQHRADDKHARWQARANELWAMSLHKDKPKSEIARLIDRENWNTIRRHISRK